VERVLRNYLSPEIYDEEAEEDILNIIQNPEIYPKYHAD